MSQVRAMRFTLERVIRGLDTISVTGNILRDYLTDLFPIMELGTSAKMLSIVPLMDGWRHVRNRRRRLGTEARATADRRKPPALGFAGRIPGPGRVAGRSGHQGTGNARAKLLAKTLDAATGKLLDNNKSPSPKTGELDNRGSQFYLAMYWAQELANQTEDKELADKFKPLAKTLTDNEGQIVAEMKTVQGKAVDIGGYYKADSEKCKAVMRPSATLNAALKAARG